MQGGKDASERKTKLGRSELDAKSLTPDYNRVHRIQSNGYRLYQPLPQHLNWATTASKLRHSPRYCCGYRLVSSSSPFRAVDKIYFSRRKPNCLRSPKSVRSFQTPQQDLPLASPCFPPQHLPLRAPSRHLLITSLPSKAQPLTKRDQYAPFRFAHLPIHTPPNLVTPTPIKKIHVVVSTSFASILPFTHLTSIATSFYRID